MSAAPRRILISKQGIDHLSDEGNLEVLGEVLPGPYWCVEPSGFTAMCVTFMDQREWKSNLTDDHGLVFCVSYPNNVDTYSCVTFCRYSCAKGDLVKTLDEYAGVGVSVGLARWVGPSTER